MQSTQDHQDRQAQWLVMAGALLFFIGLSMGLVVPFVKNVLMGQGAHMQGVLNGMVLMILGVAWGRLDLPERQRAIAFKAVLFGTFANWFFVTLGAIFGTHALAPIAGQGFHGRPWQEWLVTIGLLSVAAAMIVAFALLIRGFVRKLQY